MDAYHYLALSGEFTMALPVRLDPIDGTPLVPAHATLDALPDKKEGFARCFRKGKWEQVEDHRGKTFYAGKVPVVITRLGPVHELLTQAPPPVDDATKLAAMRMERNRRLASTDWTQLPDAPLSKQERERYAVYRQALRDLPPVTKDLDTIGWPPEVVRD